jgi:hypothetical protein
MGSWWVGWSRQKTEGYCCWGVGGGRWQGSLNAGGISAGQNFQVFRSILSPDVYPQNAQNQYRYFTWWVALQILGLMNERFRILSCSIPDTHPEGCNLAKLSIRYPKSGTGLQQKKKKKWDAPLCNWVWQWLWTTKEVWYHSRIQELHPCNSRHPTRPLWRFRFFPIVLLCSC